MTRNRLLLLALFLASVSQGVALASGPIWEPGGTKCIPNFRDERPVGYICVKVERGSIYAKTGILKGDNVLAIGGQSMAVDSEKAIDLWKEFEKVETTTVVVERGDKVIALQKPARNGVR